MANPNEGYLHLSDEVGKVFSIKDPYIIKYLLAIIVSQKLKNDPYWSFLVGPPGTGKTEYINALSEIKKIKVRQVNSLTPKTLISGAKAAGGKETSMLLDIQSGVIVIEDWGGMQSQRKEDKAEIMAQLRSIYGGEYNKTFGTGQTVSWEGKITFLAGAVPSVHEFIEQNGQLGERFTIYHLILPNQDEMLDRVKQNLGTMLQKRGTVKKHFEKYFDTFIEFPEIIPVTPNDEFDKDLREVCKLVVAARTPVPRDYWSKDKAIRSRPTKEYATRLYQQILTIAQALILININEGWEAKLTDLDKQLLVKIGLDSITDVKRITMQKLTRYEVATSTVMATALDFPTETVTRWLQDLNALGIVKRIKNPGPDGDKWQMHTKYRAILAKWEHIETLTIELDEATAEAEKAKDRKAEGIDETEAEEVIEKVFTDPEEKEQYDNTNKRLEDVGLF